MQCPHHWLSDTTLIFKALRNHSSLREMRSKTPLGLQIEVANLTPNPKGRHVKLQKKPCAEGSAGTPSGLRLRQHSRSSKMQTPKRSRWQPVDVNSPSKGVRLKIPRKKAGTPGKPTLRTPTIKLSTPEQYVGASIHGGARGGS